MRTILQGTAILAVPVLLVLAVIQPRQYCAVQSPEIRAATPSECIAKTELTSGSFKNDCLGLSFESAVPFLYGAGPYTAPFINFAVPKADYSIQVLAFQNPYKQISTPESQKAFMAAAKRNLVTRNPKIKITKEEFTSFNGVPAVYIGATSRGMVERRYYFINNGVWVELTFKSKDVNYSKKIKPAQDALIKTIKLY